MSKPRSDFETEILKPTPDWPQAIFNLNALNMPEMLATWNSQPVAKRASILAQAEDELTKKRNWKGSYERIKFALDVVNSKSITWYPDDLSDGQADDARDFLLPQVRPATTRANVASFDFPNQAAIAAIGEIAKTSVALDVEFSGSIFAGSLGTHGFSKPVRGTVERDQNTKKWKLSSDANVAVPAGTTKVGMYHTHGAGIANPGAELPSGDDIVIAISQTKLSYIGTPSGRVKKLTPRKLLPAAEQSQFPLGFKMEVLK